MYSGTVTCIMDMAARAPAMHTPVRKHRKDLAEDGHMHVAIVPKGGMGARRVRSGCGRTGGSSGMPARPSATGRAAGARVVACMQKNASNNAGNNGSNHVYKSGGMCAMGVR